MARKEVVVRAGRREQWRERSRWLSLLVVVLQDARAIRGGVILCGVVVVRVKEAKQAGGFL